MSVIKIKETREFGKFALLFSNFHLILLLARVVMGKGGRRDRNTQTTGS